MLTRMTHTEHQHSLFEHGKSAKMQDHGINSMASSFEKLHKARKISMLHALFNSHISHHMKTFIIPLSFQFNGTIEVQAESLDEATTMIQKNMHATAHIENNQDHQPTDYRSITDYNIPMK